LLDTLAEGDNRNYLELLEDDTASAAEKRQASVRLIEHLLDRHGTGRVLFRNTRDAVRGFPQRKATLHPLPLPAEYQDVLMQFSNIELSEPQLLLSPELLYQSASEAHRDWTELDPRVAWLSRRVKQLYPDKVLVITSSAQSAIDIASHLLHRAGIHAALFHEGMTIIERDRAAAFFADQESGSQLLVCSEIGSEGRNFQFAHHLIMFDLPLNPDLLEQRIGRLDRIGQRQTIEIEIPYLQQSAQEVICHWYHDGLNAFEHNSAAGHAVFVAVQALLLEQLNCATSGTTDIEVLMDKTRKYQQQFTAELQQGRNRLLEYNSCRRDVANQLQALAQYEDTVSELADYLDLLFDCFGIDSEPHSATSLIIRPGEQMQTGSFPLLTEEGMTITYRREMALSREDIHFITWAHPLVTGAMELVESSELGNTALTSIKYRGTAAGSMLLEVLFQLESTSAASSRYLPPMMIRVVVDPQGDDHASRLTAEMVTEGREFVNQKTAKTIIRAYNGELQQMVALAEQAAQKQSPQLIEQVRVEAERMLNAELHRLRALQQINPSIRQDEIDFLQQQLTTTSAAIASANLRLDALRVIVVT
jgi:ATP-dependent helicase HepA